MAKNHTKTQPATIPISMMTGSWADAGSDPTTQRILAERNTLKIKSESRKFFIKTLNPRSRTGLSNHETTQLLEAEEAKPNSPFRPLFAHEVAAQEKIMAEDIESSADIIAKALLDPLSKAPRPHNEFPPKALSANGEELSEPDAIDLAAARENDEPIHNPDPTASISQDTPTSTPVSGESIEFDPERAFRERKRAMTLLEHLNRHNTQFEPEYLHSADPIVDEPPPKESFEPDPDADPDHSKAGRYKGLRTDRLFDNSVNDLGAPSYAIPGKKGSHVYTEHPDLLSLAECWIQVFEMNEEAELHDKMSDEDIAAIISALYPRNRTRGTRDVGQHRSLYNGARMPIQKGVPPKFPSNRWGRALADPKDPTKGWNIFLCTTHGSFRACLTDPYWTRYQKKAPPLPPNWKPRNAHPFPSHAPFWFKWLDGKIVTPHVYEATMLERAKAQWLAAHPGQKWEASYDE